ncbi:MAG: carbon monoxide dehydrogenase subunit G [Betaproteobacteria bacterium]|nr:carbon monoxide dehydrogenase subunit G [Betaproteobacteria bacterium]
MNLTGEQLLPLARERVYDALLDPEILKAAIPGCESITVANDGAYGVAVVTAIGPVKARFKGTLRLENPRRPEGYLMTFEGDGGVAGFAKGAAEVRLDELGPDQTRLTYKAEARIGGRLAAIGARLINASAAKLSAQFFGKLTELLTAPEPGATGVERAAAPEQVAAGRQTPRAPETSAPASSGMVTVQMPAWAWAVTVIAVAVLVGWLGTH